MVVKTIYSTASTKLSDRTRLKTDKVTGKPVLLYPEGALMLNPTAHAIVSLCTGEASVDSIVSALADRYQTSRPDISNQVHEFLDRLRAKNLLEVLEDHDE